MTVIIEGYGSCRGKVKGEVERLTKTHVIVRFPERGYTRRFNLKSGDEVPRPEWSGWALTEESRCAVQRAAREAGEIVVAEKDGTP